MDKIFLDCLDGMHQDNIDLLLYLTNNGKDYMEFIVKFYNGNTIHNMMTYQKYKRNSISMSYSEFTEKYTKHRKKTLSILYQEPVSDSHILYIDINSITCRLMYYKLKEFPNESLWNIIKGGYTYVKEFNVSQML